MEKAQNLARSRSAAKLEAQERHERLRAKQREEEIAMEKFHEQCILEIAEKRAQKKKEKRQEEKRLKKELKEISMKQQFLQATAGLVEAKGKTEQLHGLEREARVRQEETLHKQMMTNQVNAKEYKERVKQKVQERDAFKAMCTQVDKQVAKAKKDDAALKADIRFACSTATMLRRMDETKLHATLGHSVSKYSTHKSSRIVLPSSGEVSGRSFAVDRGNAISMPELPQCA